MLDLFPLAPGPMFLWSPDKGDGGGAGSGSGKKGTDEGGTDTDDTPGTGDGGNGGSGDGLDSLDLTPEQQQILDNVISRRLERERNKAEAEIEKARKEAEKEAEEARLAEKQEFAKLADRRQETIEEQQSEIEQLQQWEKKAKKYEKALTQYRDQVIGAVPEPVQKLLESMDVADQLSWISENADQLKEQGGDNAKFYIGPPPAPKAKGGSGNGMSEDERRDQAYKPRF